ncbi:MAG: DNA-binding protein [Rhodoferax sp.]|jgi:hypothetical protein
MKKTEFIPLAQENRAFLTCTEAAPHLLMTAATLRIKGNDPKFPIKPLRVMRKMLWRTDDIRKLAAGV